MKKSHLLLDFLKSEKLSGTVLIFCAVVSLTISNALSHDGYHNFWHSSLFGKPLEFWINDGLMTIFFLLVGLEIERQIYVGELSTIRKSVLPVIAAAGGMVVPAAIHLLFNAGTSTEGGFGIPMATDIAFSLAILSLLGDRVPLSLKIFLTALAIIDDLGAIMVIAIFYSDGISLLDLGIAMGLFGIMLVINRLKVHVTAIYLTIGIFMWYFMYRSGIHATITGVLLAFAIPFGDGSKKTVSYKLQHRLHYLVALIVIPLFALSNTAISLRETNASDILSNNSLGIIVGLFVGKPLGITLFCLAALRLKISTLPKNMKFSHLTWASFLAGIGFTMSIFITLLAFEGDTLTTTSKVSIIIASLLAGIVGYFGLNATLPKKVILKK